MKARITLALLAAVVFLSGCAGTIQAPVELSKDAFSTNGGRVGVVMTKLPKADTHLWGADCLLCMAVVSVANSSLTTHARTLPHEDLPKLKDEVAQMIRSKGVEAIVIPEEFDLETLADFSTKGPNLAEKDFTPLQQKYKVDKLVVLSVGTLGFTRTYASYIATSDPKAVVYGRGYMVNLKNNTYEWYTPVTITKSTDKNWDEPPSFPGLTNAYFQALELAKDSFYKPFSN